MPTTITDDDVQELIGRSEALLDQILPQAGKLVLDIGNVNELAMLLRRMKRVEPTIHTYTSDMPRPLCPDCGAPVEQTTEDPDVPWIGHCPKGHEHTYQLDEEEDS